VRDLVATYSLHADDAAAHAQQYIAQRDDTESLSTPAARAKHAHAWLWKEMFLTRCPKCVYSKLALGGKAPCLTSGGHRKTFLALSAADRRDRCGLQHGGTVDQVKQNEAWQLRRTVNLFKDPARKAELFAMRACCNLCNQALEVLGLTREVLAYYRERTSLERQLAAAQQREQAAAAEAAAAAAAAEAAEAAAAAAWHNAPLGLF
jgi:hypothetical protein